MRKSLLKNIGKAWIPLAQKESNGAHVGKKICCALDNLFKQVAKGKTPSCGQQSLKSVFKMLQSLGLSGVDPV